LLELFVSREELAMSDSSSHQKPAWAWYIFCRFYACTRIQFV